MYYIDNQTISYTPFTYKKYSNKIKYKFKCVILHHC